MNKLEKAYEMTDRIFWIFMEKLDRKTIDQFIEDNPEDERGTRNTQKGLELFDEIESYINEKL
jgi:hypothetical protein|tara:strand:+ start:516 stop:704 length:189 start_codon:yes stop_codon:yes gene_type:complete